jgi:hypothetical protein
MGGMHTNAGKRIRCILVCCQYHVKLSSEVCAESRSTFHMFRGLFVFLNSLLKKNKKEVSIFPARLCTTPRCKIIVWPPQAVYSEHVISKGNVRLRFSSWPRVITDEFVGKNFESLRNVCEYCKKYCTVLCPCGSNRTSFVG